MSVVTMFTIMGFVVLFYVFNFLAIALIRTDFNLSEVFKQDTWKYHGVKAFQFTTILMCLYIVGLNTVYFSAKYDNQVLDYSKCKTVVGEVYKEYYKKREFELSRVTDNVRDFLNVVPLQIDDATPYRKVKKEGDNFPWSRIGYTFDKGFNRYFVGFIIIDKGVYGNTVIQREYTVNDEPIVIKNVFECNSYDTDTLIKGIEDEIGYMNQLNGYIKYVGVSELQDFGYKDN